MRGGFIVCIIFLIVSELWAAPQEWRDVAALEHIENVQKNTAQLKDLFIISPGLAGDRMIWLEKKLASIKLKNLSQEFRFKVLNSEQRGGFSMVIVAVEDPRNPLFYETLSLGFCWNDQGWKAAPLPGLFALTGAGRHEKSAEKYRETLEIWGLTESRKLQELGERELFRAFERKLSKYKQPGMPLLDGSKDEAVEYFMQLMQEKDILGLMACTLADRSNVTGGALRGKSAWSQLLQKNYTFSILPDVGIEGVVSVAVYFPNRSQSQGILEFGVTRDDGCWVLSIPQCLRQLSDGEFASSITRHNQLSPFNRTRVANVKSLILDGLSACSIQSERELLDKLLAVAAEQDFHGYLQIIDWTASFFKLGQELPTEELDQRFASALVLWQSLTGRKAVVRELLYEDKGEKYVLHNLVSYSAANPLVILSQPLLVANNGTSWVVEPEFTLKREYDPSVLSEKKIAALRQHIEGAKAKFQQSLLSGTVDGMLLEFLPITESERPQLIAFYNEYIKSLTSQKLKEALTCMASTSENWKDLLSTVGGDVKRWKSLTSRSELDSVLIDKQIAVIVLQETYKDNGSRDFIACPVVKSRDHGYRILPNYFRYEHGRGEQIANQYMLKGMEKTLADAFYKNYLRLIERFTFLVNEKLKNDNDGE